MRPLLVLWFAVALGASAGAQTTGLAERTALAHVAARSGGEAVVTGVSRSGRSRLTYVYLRPAGGGVADDAALVVVDAAGVGVYARGTVEAGAAESDAERERPAELALGRAQPNPTRSAPRRRSRTVFPTPPRSDSRSATPSGARSP